MLGRKNVRKRIHSVWWVDKPLTHKRSIRIQRHFGRQFLGSLPGRLGGPKMGHFGGFGGVLRPPAGTSPGHVRFCPIEAGVVIVYVERLSSKRWISGVDFLKNFGRLFGAETWSILSNRSGRGLLEWSSAPLGSYRNLNLIPLVVVEEKLTVMEMAWPMCIGVVVMSASVFPAGSKRRSTSR